MKTDDIIADWTNFKLSGNYSLTAADLGVIRWIIREELENLFKKEENEIAPIRRLPRIPR